MSDFPDRPGARPEPAEIRGFLHYSGWLTGDEQRGILSDLRAVARAAPLFSPMTPYGRPMSVRMTSAGKFGWTSDRSGYRYAAAHPSGTAWPPIPDSILRVWRAVVPGAREPECCLINYYGAEARMGLHQDRDERDFTQPVVSISLGDDGLFRIGGTERGGRTQSLWLRSGDVMVMGGPARLCYHGVDRIAPGTSLLLPKGGRINLTLRVVT
ncbi:alpha-ketoglutarate-dependent dioxygenase AlkB family protein [Paenirhodobacter sp.]|uniref:alpha-ketoglutarate-dependent dioxygenase AlkB family protein n=1 Tax=Paenirhodobacter sp. TaxID=1965326 RepID=UPI003B4073B5